MNDAFQKAPLNSQQVAEMTWHRDTKSGQMVSLNQTSELESDYRRWLQSDCAHPEYAMRKVKPSNGSWMYRNQCVNCGRPNGQWVKKSLIPNADVISQAPLDQLAAYEKQRYSELKQIRQQHFETQAGRGNAEYAAYLSSPAWKAKRQKVLVRANGRCEGCGENSATQVHHLTYQHIYNGFLWELVAICDGCHDRVHEDSVEDGERADEMLGDDDYIDGSEYEDEDWVE
ncbi:MAG: hypothetical protein ABI668_02810 [Sphingorhabdus sp.]